MEKEQLKSCLQLFIDGLREDLHSLSRNIWRHPEVAGQEVFAHDTLVRFLSRDPTWTVQSHYHLPTAFRASWGPAGVGGGASVLNVGFLCEYDALPGLGHACGHNLIAEVGAAAALGLKAALENQKDPAVPVKITVLGTPAEEDLGGKVELIKMRAFDNIDLVFMAHPAHVDLSYESAVAIQDMSVKYHGKASHASASPWDGVNALDAAVLAYNNLSVLRQQLKPDWKLHGIIKHGGVKPNIIPDYTELEYYLRTPLLTDLEELKVKVEACFRAAAAATGCQVEISYPGHAYSHILPNATLTRLYEQNAKSLSVCFPEQPAHFAGSTDFGNVSQIIPGIHPFFYIGAEVFNHTKDFNTAAGADTAQCYTLRAAKALAMTAVDVLSCPELLEDVREDFKRAKLKHQ